VKRRSATDPAPRRRGASGALTPRRRGASETLTPLPRAFYHRHAVRVARDLLGRLLVCDSAEGRVAGLIVETEAYRAAVDPASHAFRGRTARNAVMFGPPGHAYVYFIYGAHFCVNLVTEREGSASAVLIRALEPREGLALMARRRGIPPGPALARGPGNVGRALGLARAHNGIDLTRGPLWVADAPAGREGFKVARSPRIGLRLGAETPWRFFLAGHPCVSGPRGRARLARAGSAVSR